MNLFELQERLKDFSQDQLVREMQAPTGSAPQYLVLSELQRRQRMMAEEQARMQQPQTTVAEDAIAAAGMPQGGLADMARSMAPQTDMDMNTAAQPVERMADGGVVRMQPGGLAGISRDLDEFTGLPPEMTDPMAPRTGRPQLLIDDIRRVLEEDTDLSDAERRAYETRLATMEAIGGAGGVAGDVVQNIDDAVADAYALTGRVAGAGIEGLGYGASAILGPEVGAPILSFGESVRTSMDPIAREGFIPGRTSAEERADLEAAALTFDEEAAASDALGIAAAGEDAARVAGTFEEEALGADREIADIIRADEDADADAVVNGGGGAAAPAMDDAFDQDKWLALAQAGLSLMSSQQPTIGGAIGEAGLAGITALRQARGERDDRIERQQARADRLAAAARADREDAYPYRQVDDIVEMAKLFRQSAADIKAANFDQVPAADTPEGIEYRRNLIRANELTRRALAMGGVE
jgi:hypothetical protein